MIMIDYDNIGPPFHRDIVDGWLRIKSFIQFVVCDGGGLFFGWFTAFFKLVTQSEQ